MNRILEDLSRAIEDRLPLLEGDVKMIELACRTHALEVLSDLADKDGAKEELEASARVMNKILSIVRDRDFLLVDKRPPPFLLVTPSTAVARSFKNFDLAFTLPDHGAFEHVGENLQEETKRSLLVDLLPPEPPNFKGVEPDFSNKEHVKKMTYSNFEFIKWCTLKCIDLEAKGAVSSTEVAIKQKIALVEYVFGKMLPIPESDGPDLYYDEEDKDKVTTACEDVNGIFWHYAKACKSTEADKHLDADRLATMTSLLAIYDTLLRNSGRSEDSPAELQIFNLGNYSLDTHSFNRTPLTKTFSKCEFRSMWAAARASECIAYFDKFESADSTETSLMRPNTETKTWYLYGDKKGDKWQFDYEDGEDESDAFLKFCYDVLLKINGEVGFEKQAPSPPLWTRDKDESELSLLKPSEQEKGKKLCVWLTADWTAAPHVAKIRDLLFVYKLFLWPSSATLVKGSNDRGSFTNDDKICWELAPTFFAKASQNKLATISMGFGVEATRPR